MSSPWDPYGGQLPDYSVYDQLQGREVAEDTRRWDLDFGLKEQQLANTQRDTDMKYKIAKLQAQTAAESNAIDRWKAEHDYAIQQERNRLDAQRVEIERGAQGLNVLKTDVDLRQQPRSWTALANYERGIQGSPFAIEALRQLVSNTAAQSGGMTPTTQGNMGLPQANSLAATLAGLGAGAGAAPAPPAQQQAQTNATLAATGAPAAQGQAAAAPSAAAMRTDDPRTAGIDAIIKNWIPSSAEGWDPRDANTLGAVAMLANMGDHKIANRQAQLPGMEREIILGGMANLGRDPKTVEENWERQRVGNQASGSLA